MNICNNGYIIPSIVHIKKMRPSEVKLLVKSSAKSRCVSSIGIRFESNYWELFKSMFLNPFGLKNLFQSNV